jgi:polysaccharide biosynthesis protein PslH
VTVSTGRRSKILFLSCWFPFPADNGSKRRVRGLLEGLSPHYDVILVSFTDRAVAEADFSQARAVCQEVHLVPFKSYNPRRLSARLGFFSLTPRSLRDTFSRTMAGKIQEIVGRHKPDLIIASQLGTAIYYPFFGGRPALFEEAEAGLFDPRSADAEPAWAAARHRLTWWKHRRYLASTLRQFQLVTVASNKECELLLSIAPAGCKVEVIPNCVSLSDFAGVYAAREPNHLVFTGSFGYAPNYEAAVWFVENVFPQIKRQCSGVRLTIAGDPADRILLAVDGVVQTGYVDDVRPLIASAAVSVAPILSGGGTRFKILEAMALRTPVVATHKGAEGLHVNHDADILLADTPDEFAGQVMRLLKEPETGKRLADNAYQLLRNTYEWSIVMPRFIRLVEELIGDSHASNLPVQVA